MGAHDGRKLCPTAVQLDETLGGSLSRAIKSGRFNGGRDQMLEFPAPVGLTVSRVILIGFGKVEQLDVLQAEATGGKIVARLNQLGEKSATLILDELAKAKLPLAQMAARIALGAELSSYRFDRYRTKEKADRKPTLDKFQIALGDAKTAEQTYLDLLPLKEGSFLTRDLVSEPANVIYPESFVERVRHLSELGVGVEVLDVAEMQKLGMGALLGVGQGSVRESRMLVLTWNGAPNSSRKGPLALVGKGVCFDTGGISIKPAAGMEEMKWDMGGAAAVAGAMKLLALRKAKANVVGICGLVENMPDGNAQRPGDVVTSMSGQTIEVINTDAEGRLVLCDALWYVQEQFKPEAIIDFATLTGAIMVALGKEYAGLFSNDDKLAHNITESAKSAGEPVWRMPMGEAYDRMIDSDIADMKNTGGRDGGSITAAQFLKRFIKDNTPWAHIDIAGVAWSGKDKGTTPKGATGFGVRLIDQLVAQHFED